MRFRYRIVLSAKEYIEVSILPPAQLPKSDKYLSIDHLSRTKVIYLEELSYTGEISQPE